MAEKNMTNEEYLMTLDTEGKAKLLEQVWFGNFEETLDWLTRECTIAVTNNKV